MADDVLADDVTGLLRNQLAGARDTVYVVSQSRTLLRELIAVCDERESPPALRLLATRDPVRDVTEDFLVASRAANLVSAGTASVRILAEPPENTLLLHDDEVVSVVITDDAVAGLRTDDAAFVDAARRQYETAWDGAEEYTLRTPPRQAVRETLSAEIGEEVAADFEAVLDSRQTVRGDGVGLDEVAICLLVAAKHGVMLYDLGRWGEDVGLASRATMSRIKTRLEDRGLLDTETVPVDVGRPRQRLVLGDDRLADAEPDELSSVAERLLTG